MPRLSLSPNLLAVCFCLLVVPLGMAENWPGWRGPRGDGTSLEKEVPIRWSETENVAWKVKVPGEGHSSPVIWHDRVFLLTCLKEKQERVLLCLDRRTGKTLWQRAVFKAPLETKHNLNSYASSTPVTDGELVYVTFLEVDGSTVPAPNVGRSRPCTPGTIFVAAYDFDGNQKWIARPGEFVSAHGFCTCPVLYKDLVIINGDHDGDSYIAALKKTSGKTVWKVPREHKTRSYVTPIIRRFDGRTQMILSGSKCVTSYDPSDGSVHWQIDGPTEQFVASMVDNGKFVFLTAGFPDRHVLAIRPDGRGDVTDTHIAWRTNKNCGYVPSPVVVGGYLVVAADNGTVTCYEADSGKRAWTARLSTRYSASLMTAAGLAYLVDDDGVTKVVRPGPKLDVVATNELGEACYASPAISQGQIFIRGQQHLYCIGRGQGE